MKRAIISALFAAGVVGVASADIQAPPASEYTPTRKLGRAIANLIYSVEEIPLGIINWTSREGDYAGFSVGIVDGTATMFERMGYGIYELVTFWAPTYKCTYKPPYQGRCGMSGLKEYNPNGGLNSLRNSASRATTSIHASSATKAGLLRFQKGCPLVCGQPFFHIVVLTIAAIDGERRKTYSSIPERLPYHE